MATQSNENNLQAECTVNIRKFPKTLRMRIKLLAQLQDSTMEILFKEACEKGLEEIERKEGLRE